MITNLVSLRKDFDISVTSKYWLWLLFILGTPQLGPKTKVHALTCWSNVIYIYTKFTTTYIFNNRALVK